MIRNENVYNYKYLLVFPVMDCEVNPLEESLTSFTSFTLESGNEQNATEGEENNRGSIDRQDNKKPLKVEKTTVVVV